MAGFVTLTIKDVDSLYNSYMFFIEGGGIFIPTEKQYKMGSEIFIRLKLPDDDKVFPVAGKVVWITPLNAQANKQAGIGLQLIEKNEILKTKIEKLLTAVQSNKATYTI